MKLSELHELIRQAQNHGAISGAKTYSEVLLQLGMEPGALYQELEMDSAFVDTHRDVTYSNANVNLHSHDFFELLYCRTTGGTEYLVGTERYRLQTGDILIIAPGISHRPILPDTLIDPYCRDVIWVSSEFMSTLFQSFPMGPLVSDHFTTMLRTNGNRQKILGDLFHQGILEAENKAPGWEMAVMGNTIQILSQLFRAFMEHSASPMKAEKPELLDRIMAYVESHLEEKLTLPELARHFYVSESTISQIFRHKLGVSFHRYLTQRRLIAAKSLIAEGVQMEVVGRQLGFADYSSFYRAFKQEYGISPRQYRKLQEGSDS